MNDTSPQAAAIQLAIYRGMTPAERGEIAASLSEVTRELARVGIRMRHPSYDEREVSMALFRLVLGDELFRRAWPSAALLEP